MSNINWDEAPEGATHILISVLGDNHWYKVSGHKYASWFGGRGNWMLSGWMCSDVMKEVSCKGLSFKAKPLSIKPVFTQSMADAGELPKVGMECELDGESHTVMLGIDSDNELILSPCKGLLYWQRAHIDDIKPIDTRTDKEKAIDDIYRSYLTVKENLAEAYDKWVGK